MLDPDEMAAYEAWKAHKLTTSTDLSASAFNTEQEGPALAWEAGWDDAQGAYPKARADNPYRGSGMSGARPKKKLSS